MIIIIIAIIITNADRDEINKSFSTSEIVCNAGCCIINISLRFGPKYFSFQRREKNITQFHSSSSFAKINPVSFGVISDRMTNGTKINNLKKQNSCKIKIGEK